MIAGIEMSNNNSNIYLLTDADAKDEHLKNQVLNGLMEKHLTPKFILTGQCSRRKREISRKIKSNIKTTLYKNINHHLSIPLQIH